MHFSGQREQTASLALHNALGSNLFFIWYLYAITYSEF